jgi:hypothetical protein
VDAARRGDRAAFGRLYDRYARMVHGILLAPPPASVTREGILRLDRQMLDSWWNSLGFGDISLWRTFERDWSQRPPNANFFTLEGKFAKTRRSN